MAQLSEEAGCIFEGNCIDRESSRSLPRHGCRTGKAEIRQAAKTAEILVDGFQGVSSFSFFCAVARIQGVAGLEQESGESRPPTSGGGPPDELLRLGRTCLLLSHQQHFTMSNRSKSLFRRPNVKHFALVHRSVRDPKINDPDAGERVLSEVQRGSGKGKVRPCDCKLSVCQVS